MGLEDGTCWSEIFCPEKLNLENVNIHHEGKIFTSVSLIAGFSIEGPSQAKIECDDKGDGSCDVRYWPTEPGDYAVHVICDDEDIKDSPFMAHILPAANDVFPENVR